MNDTRPKAENRSRVRTVRRVALGITLLTAATLLISGTAILAIAGLNDKLGVADVALVLGNKVEPDGTPSARLRARLDRTMELYRAGYFPAVPAPA